MRSKVQRAGSQLNKCKDGNDSSNFYLLLSWVHTASHSQKRIILQYKNDPIIQCSQVYMKAYVFDTLLFEIGICEAFGILILSTRRTRIRSGAFGQNTHQWQKVVTNVLLVTCGQTGPEPFLRLRDGFNFGNTHKTGSKCTLGIGEFNIAKVSVKERRNCINKYMRRAIYMQPSGLLRMKSNPIFQFSRFWNFYEHNIHIHWNLFDGSVCCFQIPMYSYLETLNVKSINDITRIH